MQTPSGLFTALPERRARGILLISVVAFVAALLVYLLMIRTHRLYYMLSWFDLRVYNRAGLVARRHPRMLYVWQSIRFTYTPFAALVFAVASKLPWVVLRVLVTGSSIAALLAVAWRTFGGLGWRGRIRVVATLALFALGFWAEPVQRALRLGQIELWLMVLIVWDMTLSDRRWWKGAGIGIAAGIKLVPLIFIPYLLLAGKVRQAAVATAVFGGTVLAGFVFLPAASSKWWWTGYFLSSGRVGGVESHLNQSLLGLLARAAGGDITTANDVWVPLAVLIGMVGLLAAAMLHRAGQPVAGWLGCSLTGLLISPISWDHHWLWVVPALALLTDAAIRGRGGVRWPWWALTGFLIVVYQGWPRHFQGPKALLPEGLLGYLPFFQQNYFAWIYMNLYVLAGLVGFAILVVVAVRTWQAGQLPPDPPPDTASLPAPTVAASP